MAVERVTRTSPVHLVTEQEGEEQRGARGGEGQTDHYSTAGWKMKNKMRTDNHTEDARRQKQGTSKYKWDVYWYCHWSVRGHVLTVAGYWSISIEPVSASSIDDCFLIDHVIIPPLPIWLWKKLINEWLNIPFLWVSATLSALIQINKTNKIAIDYVTVANLNTIGAFPFRPKRYTNKNLSVSYV